jgi:hypothetical protein
MAMSELDKLMEKLNAFADTPLGAEIVAAGVAAAKPGDGIAQGPGKKPRNRADLKELAKTLRRLLDSLYTMGSPNDPWMAEADFRSKHAYWVANIFERFGITQSVIHARQLHYRLVSQETPVLQADGKPYVNSGDCYNRLCDAIRDARYLDLISTDVIIDRRNPEPTINFYGDEDVGAKIEIHHGAVTRYVFGNRYDAPWYGLPAASRLRH